MREVGSGVSHTQKVVSIEHAATTPGKEVFQTELRGSKGLAIHFGDLGCLPLDSPLLLRVNVVKEGGIGMAGPVFFGMLAHFFSVVEPAGGYSFGIVHVEEVKVSSVRRGGPGGNVGRKELVRHAVLYALLDVPYPFGEDEAFSGVVVGGTEDTSQKHVGVDKEDEFFFYGDLGGEMKETRGFVVGWAVFVV